MALLRLQDVDFAALYKAYDDELMAWKSKIDVRHDGEKRSKGACSFVPAGCSLACARSDCLLSSQIRPL